jgi:prepilin-type N-terminal cleavage/methylation domain-containing protein
MRRHGAVFNRRGFTLVEIMVAVAILLVVVTASVPLFVYIAEATQANRARLAAAKIAGTEIERVRALPYNQVGNVGGNPPGVIQRLKTEVLGGITYSVTTDVWWWDDPSDGLGGAGAGADPIPYDYKRVRVAVAAPGLFSGAVTLFLNLDTLAALEGEEEAFPGGNIRASVQRGWKTGTEEVPVGDVRVDLTSGPNAPQTLWTDEFGRALFAILAEGAYTVAADAAPLGMMVRPDQAPLQAAVTQGVTSELTFEVEYPCRLSLNLRDRQTGQPVQGSGTVILVTPYSGEPAYPFTTGADGVIGDIFGPLWPVGGHPGGHPGAYSLKVQGVSGYAAYDMANPDHERPKKADGTAWDGTFAAPGTSLEVTVYLHGSFYREPVPVPFQTARLLENVEVSGENELVLRRADAVRELLLSPAYASTTSASGSEYRGYRFRVTDALTVTHLIGGGTTANFAGGLYRAAGNQPVELLGWAQFPAGRQQEAALAAPVTLVPNQDYVVAQGRTSGSGSHQRVGTIGVSVLLSGEPYLSEWFPTDGNAIYWNRTGAPSVLVNRPPTSISNTTRPDLGFRYRALAYLPAGQRISEPIDLSRFTVAPALKIWWGAVEPPGTAVTVATAITTSTATPGAGAFSPVGNGAVIPGITPGENLAGRYLWVREGLTTANPTRTPRLQWLAVDY